MALLGGLRGENGTVMCERATGHRQGCRFSWLFANVPQFTDCQAKEYYSVRDVSALTRDQVLPNQGGECIGLGQVVGQGGRKKPLVKAPIQGLFYVGCDAGGYRVGIQQAVDSESNVASVVLRYHLMHQALQ